MADESTMELESAAGQPAEGSETTTQTGPEFVTDEQSVESGTTASGHQENATVYDPEEFNRLTQNLTPELKAQAQALQKSLQSGYTKKFQEISANRQKIEAYEAFSAGPVGQMERMAKQLGYRLDRANNASEQQQNEWEPKTWDDVMERATKQIMEKLSPVLGEVQNIKRNSIEQQLSEIDPTWKQYETDMMDKLKAHPTLSKDPAMLYRMSVPPEVLESRAIQKALSKMQDKVKSGQVNKGSTTTRTANTGLPDKPVSFADAINAARKQLEREGIRQN